MGLLDKLNEIDELVENAKSNIKKVYLMDNKPWVIGYSGGKDSTTVLQLVVEAIIELKNEGASIEKKVYVISSDTMVETPLIISSIGNNLKLIQEFANSQKLPIETQLVKPAIDNTFWVNLIGKGYPAPNQSFRWCTDRMKIEPTNRFIKEKIDDFGQVIVLLGVREGESSSRDKVIKNHEIEGKLVMKHSSLKNALTFAPIKNFTIPDVWEYLLKYKSPWGFDNEELFKLYADSSANECPLIIDKETKEKSGSCGNSRFGCWVCTVVSEDKALSGFVNNGEEWLRPLLDYRNWISKNRDTRDYRMKSRANGNVYTLKLQSKEVNGNVQIVIPRKSGREKEVINIYNDGVIESSITNTNYDLINRCNLNEYLVKNNVDLTSGDAPNLIIKDEEGYYFLGLGPYTFETRELFLMELLKIQKLINEQGFEHELITLDEINEIRKQWYKRGCIEDRVSQIYFDVFGDKLNDVINDIELITKEQLDCLSVICRKNNVYIKPLTEMLKLQKTNGSLKAKKDRTNKINDILTKDYLNY